MTSPVIGVRTVSGPSGVDSEPGEDFGTSDEGLWLLVVRVEAGGGEWQLSGVMGMDGLGPIEKQVFWQSRLLRVGGGGRLGILVLDDVALGGEKSAGSGSPGWISSISAVVRPRRGSSWIAIIVKLSSREIQDSLTRTRGRAFPSSPAGMVWVLRMPLQCGLETRGCRVFRSAFGALRVAGSGRWRAWRPTRPGIGFAGRGCGRWLRSLIDRRQ